MVSTLTKRWLISERASRSQLRRFNGLSPILAQVLINRGFETPQAAWKFLNDRKTTHNPFDMPDMKRAAERILDALAGHEHIVVYGDFDADGVTATALLVEGLTELSQMVHKTNGTSTTSQITPYIPHRIDEGYGLNKDALEHLAAEGADLVITVDCGIRSIQEVEDGKAAGLDIIVTDHHSLGPELPRAYAVINPKREGYKEPMLAGVGVAFKLVQALIMQARDDQRFALPDPLQFHRDLLDLVAIGTVADVMPLDRAENRVLVRRGLSVIQSGKRPGLRALMEVARGQIDKADAMAIGFVIGPRINAAGRLDHAMEAYHLLTARDDETAAHYARILQDLNRKRQDVTRQAQAAISQQLQADSGDLPLIFASDASLSPGIVGLVAGRLTEEYFRPAIVMEEGEEESRASCRSIPQFDITAALDECADLLIRHGGHALAAGFTVHNDNIDRLRHELTERARTALDGQLLKPTLPIDVEIDIEQLSETLAQELTLLEPCGKDNALPVFMCRAVRVESIRTVGTDDKHLKLSLHRSNGPPLDAIGFGLGGWKQKLNSHDRIDIAFHLEINEWHGRRNLQANLQDIRHPHDD
jgi:single-stranded-DNA-specific exonuclease